MEKFNLLDEKITINKAKKFVQICYFDLENTQLNGTLINH